MIELVTVAPVEPGWTVRWAGLSGDLMFRSGFAAERSARQLADAIARSGTMAELRVQLRDGSIGGRFVRPPDGAPTLSKLVS